jgi:hypothetical protein
MTCLRTQRCALTWRFRRRLSDRDGECAGQADARHVPVGHGHHFVSLLQPAHARGALVARGCCHSLALADACIAHACRAVSTQRSRPL